jgi:hypothetical protein
MIISAIRKINPDAEFTINADDIDQITWLNGTVEISKAEIDAEVIKLQAEYDAQAYSRNREAEYPSIQECVHAILDDTLDALQAKRVSVKLKYPKGG